MRIAFLSPYPAGLVPDYAVSKRRAEHPVPWVRALGRALAEHNGVEIRVFTLSRRVKKAVTVDDGGLEVRFIPQRWPANLDFLAGWYPNYLRLRESVNGFAPDIVYGFGMETGYGEICSRFNNALKVCFLQGIMEQIAPWWPGRRAAVNVRKWHESRRSRNIDLFVAENEFSAAWARRHRPDTRIAIIPHPVDPDFLAASAAGDSPPAGGDNSKPCFLCVGSLHLHKGVDLVLKAFAAAGIEAELDILGDGPERARLQNLAAELGLSARAHFHGAVDRATVKKRMLRSRALLLASRMDTSPNVVTEAQALGLAVIAARAGGIPEMIDDGSDGYLVEPGDWQAMGKLLRRLYEDPAEAERTGKAARARIEREHHPDNVARRHLELLSGLRKEDFQL